jgi:hypothetical protein
MFLPLGVMKAEPQILNVLEDLVHRHSRLLVFTGSQFQSGLRYLRTEQPEMTYVTLQVERVG